MSFYKCGIASHNLEPLKHVGIPVGGYYVEANGTPVTQPNNIKKVFPQHYNKMTAEDFTVSATLGSIVFANKSETAGYTRANVSNIAYDADTGTLTASVSISRTGGNVGQIFQGASAKWNGTVSGKEL